MGFSIIRFRPYWMGDAGLAPNLQAVGVGKGENAEPPRCRERALQAGGAKGPVANDEPTANCLTQTPHSDSSAGD